MYHSTDCLEIYSFACPFCAPKTNDELVLTLSLVSALDLFRDWMPASIPPSITHLLNTSVSKMFVGSELLYDHIACSRRYTLEAIAPPSMMAGRGTRGFIGLM